MRALSNHSHNFQSMVDLVPADRSEFSWADVCELFPFLPDLDNCEQDATHHAEGNVGILPDGESG